VHQWTAANHDSGWMFILIGAVFVLGALLPPLVSTRKVQPQEATATEREPVSAEQEPAAVADPTVGEESRPQGVGAASPTQTETDVEEPDNISTHATG